MNLVIECPGCLHVMDTHDCVITQRPCQEQPQPRPGDATICIRCGAVLIYEDKGVRLASEDEAKDILSNPAVARLVQRIKSLPKDFPGLSRPGA